MSLKPINNLVLFKRTLMSLAFGLFLSATASVLCGGFAIPGLSSERAYAAANSNISFQARLEGAGGNIAPDGYYNIEFKLYSASSGGTALWTEDYYDSNGPTAGNDNRVQVINGYVTVNLGSQTAFPSTIDWSQLLYLTMNVGGTAQTATPTYDGEMNPRLQLTAVPYAFKAGSLSQYNTSTGFTSSLNLLQPTGGNQIFQIADQGAAGTYNLLTTAAASSSFIQNSTSLQTGANFNISGTGVAATLQANTVYGNDFGRNSAGTLTFGNLNATTIGIGTNALAHTINVATDTTTVQTLNLGSSYGASSVLVASGSGGIMLGSGTANTTTNNANFINTGSTLNSVSALSNFTMSGDIGTAAATVNTRTAFTINQTTAGISLTIPSPTASTAAGRVIYITNTGSVSFNLIGSPLAPNASATLIWSGSVWTYSGADANSILNQTGSTQTAGFNISGSATLGQLQVNGPVAFKNTTNSTTAFQIQNATGTNLFTADTSGMNVTIGSATNGVTFGSTFEPVLTGTARHAKTIVLPAEYQGTVLDAGTGSSNLGTMTSGIDLTSRMNYYKWTTTQSSNQSYDVDVQVQLPSDFDSWGSAPLSISGYSSDLTNGLIKVEARDTTGAVICNFVAITPSSTSTWSASSACALSTGTYTAGSYITLRLRLQAGSGGDTRVGNLVFNYNSKY